MQSQIEKDDDQFVSAMPEIIYGQNKGEEMAQKISEIKENWLQLVANAEDVAPFDVVIARGDYVTMMSLICGDT